MRLTEDEDGNPLDIGRKTRSIPSALRRALNTRDQGCRFPGWCNKEYVDGHHIEHWADGAFRFIKPNGESLDSVIAGYTSNWMELPKLNHESGILIDHRTAATRWRGEAMDYGLAVQVLCQREATIENVLPGDFRTTP